VLFLTCFSPSTQTVLSLFVHLLFEKNDAHTAQKSRTFSRFSAFEVTTLWRYTNLCIIISSSTTIIITVVVFLFSFIFTPGINDPGIKN